MTRKIVDIKTFKYGKYYMVDVFYARGPMLVAITYPYLSKNKVFDALKALGNGTKIPEPDDRAYIYFMGKNNSRVR